MSRLYIEAAKIYCDDIAKEFVKAFGKRIAREQIEEDRVPKYLENTYPGIKFMLSEINEIEDEINKLIKIKKKSEGDSMPNTNIDKDDMGNLDVFIHPATTMKLESEGNYILYKAMPGVKADQDLLNEIKSKLAETKLYGQFHRFIKDGFIIKKESVVAVDKILNDLDVSEYIKSEITQKELDNMPVDASKKVSDINSVPKPTTPPPSGMVYAFNEKTQQWELRPITNASLDLDNLGIISSKQFKKGDEYPSQNNSTSTGYKPGWNAAPMGTYENSSIKTEDVKVEDKKQDTKIDKDSKEWQTGLTIEKEHQPTYDMIKQDIEKNGKLTITPEQMFESIVNDHVIKEGCGVGYYSDERGLPDMERRLGCENK